MNDLFFTEAERRANAALQKMQVEDDLDNLIFVEDGILETEEAWYFPYDSEAYLLRGDLSAALAGNLPIKVLRDGTAVACEAPPLD
ncbi:YrhB domain-containing protein [Mycobacterium asiaticum]|uniref:YrhB domain-containing protein n=1 Tax=Mycobacterium asiaticum TaxID=1790 RepID=UPI0009BF5E38|nr:YrhB domain-containing protein [Mycobacterium asiaticum]